MSTRQTTPGPSTAVLQSTNAKKRASSNDLEQPREQKKTKRDVTLEPTSPASVSVNLREKDKKKRRKKKKKLPISASDSTQQPQQRRRSTSAPNSVRSIGARDSVPGDKFVDTSDMKVDDNEEQIATSSSSDKGKAKATSPIPPLKKECDERPLKTENEESISIPTASTSSPQGTLTATSGSDTAESQIVHLREELAQKTALLNRHESHLSTMQQSLTCEICLDLLHKPFALSPCGHVACHPCLVRWFTSPAPGTAAPAPAPAPANANNNTNNNDSNSHNGDRNGNIEQDPVQRVLNNMRGPRATHLYKRKTCPVCRAVVSERPVEVWSVKSMVAALVKSKLVELPVPPPAPDADNAAPNGIPHDNDPWQNIFRRPVPRAYNNHNHGMLDYDFAMLPPWFIAADERGLAEDDIDDEEVDAALMGVRDDADGGIYRCPRCFSEIWNGSCTGCQRIYPGQGFDSEEDDDGDGDGDDDQGDSEEDSDRGILGGWFGAASRVRHRARRGRRDQGTNLGGGIRIRHGTAMDDDYVEGGVEPYPADDAMGMRFNFEFRRVDENARRDEDGGSNHDGEESDAALSYLEDGWPALDNATDVEEGVARIEEVASGQEEEVARIEEVTNGQGDEDEDEEYDSSFIDDDDDDENGVHPAHSMILRRHQLSDLEEDDATNYIRRRRRVRDLEEDDATNYIRRRRRVRDLEEDDDNVTETTDSSSHENGDDVIEVTDRSSEDEDDGEDSDNGIIDTFMMLNQARRDSRRNPVRSSWGQGRNLASRRPTRRILRVDSDSGSGSEIEDRAAAQRGHRTRRENVVLSDSDVGILDDDVDVGDYNSYVGIGDDDDEQDETDSDPHIGILDDEDEDEDI